MPEMNRRLLWLWAFDLITKNHTWCAREAQTKHIIRHSSARWKRSEKKNNKRKAMFMNYEYSFVVAIGGGDGTTECDGSPNIYLCSDWMLGFFRSIIYSLSSVNCRACVSAFRAAFSQFFWWHREYRCSNLCCRSAPTDDMFTSASETNAHRKCV